METEAMKKYSKPETTLVCLDNMQQLLAASVPVLGDDYDGTSEVLAPETEFDLDEPFGL